MNKLFRLPRRFLMTAGELLMEAIAPLTFDHLGYDTLSVGLTA